MGKIYKNGIEYGGGGEGSTSDFDDLTNRPQEPEPIDISELDLPMPTKPTEYPVLFDESGTEYQVGLYKRASDGKVKPVYRKDYKINKTANTIDFDIPIGVENFENVKIKSGSYNVSNNSLRAPILPCWITSSHESVQPFWQVWIDTNTIRIRIGSLYSDQVGTICITIEYTKTTDEWKEV